MNILKVVQTRKLKNVAKLNMKNLFNLAVIRKCGQYK